MNRPVTGLTGPPQLQHRNFGSEGPPRFGFDWGVDLLLCIIGTPDHPE